MKKNNLYFSALVLILGLSFTNCHSSSDNSLYQTNALLLNYVNGLLAGNCAQVTKATSSASVITYTATGYNIPTGGCSSATLGANYTTTAADLVTLATAYFTRITTILDAQTACASMSTIVKGTNAAAASTLATSSFVGSVLTATTAANITALATANTADSTNSSGVFSPKNCITVKTGLLYTSGIFCSSAADSTTAQSNVKYYVVNSVQTDMATSFEGNRTILYSAKTTTDSVNFYTNAAIAAMRLMTSTEVSTLTSTTNNAKLDSYALVLGLYSTLAATALASQVSTAPSCLAALTASDSTLKDYLIRIPTAQYTTSTTLNSNIAFGDKQAVTTPFIPSLSCKYGAGFTTATTTVLASSTPAVPVCPSTYTQF
jgi:hypothetical protein